jgi:putative component of membrane protein insertase Oxa1/YidC/SpoIIIJ protein YidD
MALKTMLSIAICLGISLQAKSQISADINFIRTHNLDLPSKTIYNFRFDAKSEYDYVAKFAFTFYKKYVSSQDAISCTFEPSCSVYGIEAVQEYGFFLGGLATFDRLSRCHGWNHSYYPRHEATGLNFDPIHSHEAH